MAELIDKGKILYDEVTDERGRTYEVAYVEQIERLPSVTEAEIRAKAISVMGMAMKEAYPTHKANYVEFDVFFRDVMLKVAEQLKEET